MSGNLRDIREIEQEIEAAGKFGLTRQQILDLLRSQAKVAGTLSVRGGTATQTLSAGWNRLDLFDTSRDTQGVREGLLDDPAGSYFTIRNGADGDYTLTFTLRFSTDTAGLYEFRFVKATETSPDVWETSQGMLYRDAVDLSEPGTEKVSITGLLKNIAQGERLFVEYRGPNGSQVTALYGQFGVER